MKSITLVINLALLSTFAAAQSIQLLNVTVAASNFTSSCVAVLNQVVTCDSSIKWAGGGRYEDDVTLSTLCTTACSSSLSGWLRRVSGACTQRFVGTKGDAVLPALWAEKVVEKFNLLCFKDSAGSKFCNAVLRDTLGINADDQKQTKTPASTASCDDCFLKQIQTQLQMPLKSNSDLARTFTSLTKQCVKTGFAVTTPSPSTQWILWSTPAASSGSTPTPTGCQGTTYAIKSGDTCQSVSSANGLNTADLLMSNNLQAFCVKFPTSGSLCIPKAAKCTAYTIRTGDTCASIGTANKLTWTQVVTWNANFGEACQSIGQYVGWTACISQPGGNWVNPDPTTPRPSSVVLTPTWIGTAASLLPKATFGGMINGSDVWTYKYAEGTRLDCRIYANGTDFGSSAACADVAKGYGVSTLNLTTWNPSLLKNSCVLDGKLTYCVQAVRLNATNITPYCVLSETPDYGLSCEQFLSVWSISIENFSAWNSGVGTACENWVLGREYCVRVKHFRQPGIVSTCNQFVMSNISNVRMDPCGVIEAKYGLQHARFVAWNPAVTTNCTEMEAGYDYCVSIPNFKPVYSSYVPPWPTTPFKIKSLGAAASSTAKAANDVVKSSAKLTSATSATRAPTSATRAASTKATSTSKK